MKRIAARVKPLALGDRLVRRNPLVYPRARALFERLLAAPLEERQAVTGERLRAVLAAAARTPYGRRVEGKGDLSAWPLLDKEALRDDPTAFLGRGARLSVPASTSGTSGVPLRLRRSLASIAVEQAAIDTLLVAQGLDLGSARYAVLRGDDIKDPADASPPFWQSASGGRRLVFSSNHLKLETLEEFVGALRSFRPDCLLAYPTILESLCRLLRRSGERVQIPLTFTSSELLTPYARALAADLLATTVVDFYGQAERVNAAYSVSPGAYFFLPGHGCTELLHVGADDGDDVYEIVGTSLWNMTMPLVRYRTGDFVLLPAGLRDQELERIAYGLEPVPGILGRSGDFLVSPEGSRLMGIDHIPRDVENVVRIQVVQEAPERVRILVIPTERYSQADAARIGHNVSLKLPPSMAWSLELVEELERTPQGKAPLVIRRPGVDSAAIR